MATPKTDEASQNARKSSREKVNILYVKEGGRD